MFVGQLVPVIAMVRVVHRTDALAQADIMVAVLTAHRGAVCARTAAIPMLAVIQI